MPVFSLSEGERQQPPKHTISTAEGSQQLAPTAVALAAAAPADEAVTGTRVFPTVLSKGVAEAPASSAGAASAAVPAAAPATSGTVPSVASFRGAVAARESSAGPVSSDAAAEAATSTGGTATPVALAARAARALESTTGSSGDSWTWAISQGCLRFYPRRRVLMWRLPPRPPPFRQPELSTCPACDLKTPDMHAQAHAGRHSKIWRAAEDKDFGGLRAIGTFEELGGT